MQLKKVKIKKISKLKYPQPVFDFTVPEVHHFFANDILSSNSYNGKKVQGVAIQTVPRKPEIRQQFTAPKGSRIVENDGSQQELRIMAWYSQDPIMLKAFRDKEDLHLKMALKIHEVMNQNKLPYVVEENDTRDKFRLKGEEDWLTESEFINSKGFKPEDCVTVRMRKIAKGVNFGVGYGGGCETLCKKLNEKLDAKDEKITIELTKLCIKAFSDHYKVFINWRKKMISYLHKHGKVVNPLGRVRRLPEVFIGKRNKELSMEERKIIVDAENEAINALIQGLGSDLVKLANNRAMKRIKDLGLKTVFLFDIHDANFHEVPNSELEIVLPIIKEEMEREIIPGLKIPVECTIWEKWGGRKLTLEEAISEVD